ncbi:MAG: hypothetical protein ABL957_10695 [Parvularculaceae bacterium]
MESESTSTAVALELTAFNVADIERLAGVSRDAQRDRRRRKTAVAMPRGAGHARHAKHVGDLVQFALIAEIAGRVGGLGPAARVAAMLMPAVLWRIMSDPRAWEESGVVARRPEERVDLVLAALGQKARPPEHLACGVFCGGHTLLLPDLDAASEFARRIGAPVKVCIDLDLFAANFLKRAKGQPFARLSLASPEEAAFLKPRKGDLLQ